MTITAPPAPEVIAKMMMGAISGTSDNTTRSMQKGAGILGPSDIGFCRNKAALVSRQVTPTDARMSIWAAVVGTAVHVELAKIFGEVFPDWIIEDQRVTAVLPNGAEISGTPDIIVPEWNLIIDIKTVNGLTFVQKDGPSQSHRYQRFLYADGACRAGVLDKTKPVYVANVWFDRSGRDSTPYVDIEECDWSLADTISEWIDDVIYAVTNKEDASRDIPAAVCEKICEFYTACRGSLPVEDSELITDDEVLSAVETYTEARDTKRALDKQMNDAKAILTGINGSTGRWQVRTTNVPASERAASSTRAYDKLEVVKVRTRA